MYVRVRDVLATPQVVPADVDPVLGAADIRIAIELGHVHNVVTPTPSLASRARSSGSEMPSTLPWSPSIPATNQPPRPSRVNAPATCSGSPLATYASISASDGVPNRTVVCATATARCPVAALIRQWPVHRVPVR